MFLTSAADGCVKLWDVRVGAFVRRFEGHVNRQQPVGAAFSPCGRYFATGSEDKCTFLFDLRMTTYVEKLTGSSDVVSDVAFHPAHPQLAAASYDGKIRFYTDRP
mmetsp:Transcript_27654/g.39103  ORF Transcript_27654/g.39103 Transcript_27654/m.39103 type:complete len:105 (+) Transcript_27654:1-315(+)